MVVIVYGIVNRTVSIVAGDGVEGALTDVSATSSTIAYPLYLVIDSSDNVYVSLDTGFLSKKIHCWWKFGCLCWWWINNCSTTASASTGITATSASIGQSLGLASDTYQNFYVVYHSNSAILVIGGGYSTSVTVFQY